MSDLTIRTIRKSAVTGPTARDVGMFFFRRKGMLLSLSFATLLVIALSVLMPRRPYVSEMQILVDRGPFDAEFLSATSHLLTTVSARVTAEDMSSEIELLESVDLLENIVQACGLENQENSSLDKSALLTQFFGRIATPREQAVARATQLLKDRLDVKGVPGTNLIRVAYTSPDPGLSARVFHAAAALLEQKRQALRRQSSPVAFLDQQTNRDRDALATAEQQLADFDRTHAFNTQEEQQGAPSRQFDEMETVLRENQTLAHGFEQRVKTLREETATAPERRFTQTKETDNAELLSRLEDTLLSLELKRSERLQKYAPEYPLVRVVETEIAQTRVALAQAEESPITETIIDRNPAKEWIATELAKAEADKATFEAQSDFAARAVRRYQRVAQTLERANAQRENLVRDVRNAEDDYFLYRHKASQALASETLGSGDVTLSFSRVVTTLAEPPLRFEWVLMGGLFAATIVSVGGTYGIDRMDPRFRTPEELSGFLHVRVLASIPASEPRL